MGALKTFSMAFLASILLSVPAGAGHYLSKETAICAGKLSAQLEFQWLMRDPEATRTEAARDAMVELLHALSDPDDRGLLSLRVEAKQAHAALLSRAAFGPDKRAATQMETAANKAIGTCRKLVDGYLPPLPESA